MISFFDGQYFISSDDRQWKIIEPYFDKKNNKVINKAISFHGSLGSAVKELFDRKVRLSE